MTEVHTSGPIFDGRAQRAMHDYASTVRHEIATEGADMIVRDMWQVQQHPTGYLLRHVRPLQRGVVDVVDNGDVVYSRWIEGVGKKNKTTRFKGYATFARMTTRLQARAVAIAKKVLPDYVDRMN